MLISQHTKVLSKKFGVENAVKMLAAAGFTAVDISMFDKWDPPFLDNSGEVIKKLNKLKKELGIIYNQAHAPVGTYEEYMEKVIPSLPSVIAAAGELEIKNLVVHPIMKGYYYDNAKEMFDINIDFYASLIPYARAAGVKIAIENMWERHRVTDRIIDNIAADPRELSLIYDTLNTPDVFTVCLDIGHTALCGREPEDAVRIIGGDRLGALHVHDVDYKEDWHTLPGIGNINWDRVARALADVDYKGDLTLEAYGFYKNFEDDFLPEALKFMAIRTQYLADKIETYKVENGKK